jgi:hypothetical protein
MSTKTKNNYHHLFCSNCKKQYTSNNPKCLIKRFNICDNCMENSLNNNQLW